MSVWQKLKVVLDDADVVLNHPLVAMIMAFVGDVLMGHVIAKKTIEGQVKREINPRWLRTEAPHLFAKTNLDENLLRRIVYSKHVKLAYRVALFDKWGPDPTINMATTVPVPSLGQIGPHQWDDFRLSLVEEMFKTDPANPEAIIPLTTYEEEAKLKELGEFLTELAKLPNAARLGRLVKIHYCRALETDYKVVQFQQFRHRVFTTVGDLLDEIGDWVNDPGPTGYIVLATMAAAGVRASAPAVRGALDNAATAINAKANRVHPKGLIGWIVGK